MSTETTPVARRDRDHCSHGVPLYPAQECRECSIVWYRECLKNAQERVAAYKAELTKLGVRDDA